MSADHDELIRAAFEDLQREFSSKLPARIATLAAAIRAASAARDDLALREEARGSAHRLRGSAGSYGFPTVSVMAQRIEEALIALKASPTVDPEPLWATIAATLAELEGAERER